MRTISLRLLALLVAAVLLPFAGMTAADAAPAGKQAGTSAQVQARGVPDKCVQGSTSSSGTCYKYLSSVKKVVAVEAVPIRNRSSRKAEFTCSFTRTITKSVEWGGSITSSAEVGAVFGLAKISIAATISKKETQTAQQASSVQGKFTLRPGEEATCVRTYGSVVMRVQKYSYSGSRVVSRTNYNTQLPSYLGVDLVD